jgi:ACS family hexuronate transporter-like MFS transporter
MLFLAAILNYIDRSVLGLLAPTIQRDLRISDRQYASVVNCFLVAYTIVHAFSETQTDMETMTHDSQTWKLYSPA